MVEDQMRINKLSPVPMYQQLKEILEKMISSKKYKSGDYLPGENELCKRYDVSRTTVRQTISELLQEGVIYRKQPRGRLIVAPIIVHQSPLKLYGFFTEGMLTAGLKPFTEVISIEKVKSGSISAKLSIRESSTLYKIERLHYGDKTPLAFQISYVPVKRFPDLEQCDLSQSLLACIEEKYGQKTAKAKQKIGVQLSPDWVSMLMNLPPRAPLFNVERVTYAVDGMAVEFFECYLRGDRYNFEMELD